jgi:hypothetical protein
METDQLNEGERAVIQPILEWAKSWQAVRQRDGGILYRIVTPQDEVQYYTLVRKLEPRVIFHEPVRFVTTVHAAKGECRAGHVVGDR